MVLKTRLPFLLVKSLQEETALHWLQFKGLGLHFNCGVKMSVQELSSLFQAQKQLLGESREVDL